MIIYIQWKPFKKQWWITAFNPEYAGNVDVHKQVMVGKIDMSQFEDSDVKSLMFEELHDDIVVENSYNICHSTKNQIQCG